MATQNSYGAVMLIREISDPSVDVINDATINSTPGIYIITTDLNASIPTQSIGYLYVTPINEDNGNLLRFHDLQTGLWFTYLVDQWVTTTPESIGALALLDTAVAANKLSPGRTIGGVFFDGSQNINLPGVNVAGTQNTSGNAGSATKLQTARTINGVSFNGTANITISAAAVGAYTTAQSDARYVQNLIRGARVSLTMDGAQVEAPAGCVLTGGNGNEGTQVGIAFYRPLMILINGSYRTITD